MVAERSALGELLSALGTSLAGTSDRKRRVKSATHYTRSHPNESPRGVSGDEVDVGSHMLSMLRDPANYLSKRCFDALDAAVNAQAVADENGAKIISTRRPKLFAMMGEGLYRF